MVFHDRVEQHISSSEESCACFSQKKAFSLDTINFSITRSTVLTSRMVLCDNRWVSHKRGYLL